MLKDTIKDFKEEIKEEGRRFETETLERVVGYIVGALGVVAGLAWNEAMAELIQYFVPLGRDSLFLKILYALIVTMVVVIVSMYLVRLSKRKG